MNLKPIAAMIALSLALAGCGNKGPLVQAAPPPIESMPAEAPSTEAVPVEPLPSEETPGSEAPAEEMPPAADEPATGTLDDG
jgi:predicted small lipoprotein YifL